MYNITRGQLITIWVFGLFSWIFTFYQATDSYSSIKGFWGILAFVIPGALIFYTIGWRNYKKRASQNKEEK